MDILGFTLLLGGSCAAGFLGALTGLGGGVVIVPLLVIAFGVDLRYAIGASLVSVVATSSGAAAAYVREGFSNLRVGMFLEMATTIGAVCGAMLAAFLDQRHRCRLRDRAVLFHLCRIAAACLVHRRRPAGPAGDAAADGLDLSDRGRPARLPRAQRARRLRHHVGGRRTLRPARHRLRRRQGVGDGPGDAHPSEGLDDDQQLHDRSDGRRQRRHLSEARSHRSRHRHAGDAGRARRLARRRRVLSRMPTNELRWVFCAVMAAAAVEMLRQSLAGTL